MALPCGVEYDMRCLMFGFRYVHFDEQHQPENLSWMLQHGVRQYSTDFVFKDTLGPLLLVDIEIVECLKVCVPN